MNQSRGIQYVEFGKDKENLGRFISTFNDLRKLSMGEDFQTNDIEGLQLNLV